MHFREQWDRRRESDGWENVIGNLKEAWKQFQAVIGKPLLQALVPIIKSITSAIQTLTEVASKATQAMSELFGWDLAEQSSGVNDLANNTANSVTSAVENAESNTQDSMKDTVESVKEAQKQLAGFDNLNVLSQDKSSDSKDEGETDTGAETSINSTLEPVNALQNTS